MRPSHVLCRRFRRKKSRNIKKRKLMYSQSQGVPSGGPVGGNQHPIPFPSAPVYPALPHGYGHSGDTAYVVPPPAYQLVEPTAQRIILPITAPSLTEEEIRIAVAKHVSGHVFYSSSAVEEMKYALVEASTAYIYELQSFTESRETKWLFEPHHSRGHKLVDGPHNGPIPEPWEVPVAPKQEFVCGKAKVRVPHSEFVAQCHTCFGAQNTRCSHCAGMGSRACTWCDGSGVRTQISERRPCTSCSATGRDKCTWCHGHGFNKCPTCSAYGQLKYYIELKVKWNIHSESVVSNGCGLKEKKIIQADKVRIFEETGAVLTAISPQEFTDQTIVSASVDLIHQQLHKTPNERVIKMKHTISALPITTVYYQYKNRRDSFFVYGDDKKVHFKTHPSKNCCIS